MCVTVLACVHQFTYMHMDVCITSSWEKTKPDAASLKSAEMFSVHSKSFVIWYGCLVSHCGIHFCFRTQSHSHTFATKTHTHSTSTFMFPLKVGKKGWSVLITSRDKQSWSGIIMLN